MLENVQMGDQLIWNGRGLSERKVVRVDRTTKTQIIIGRHRFRKSDGYTVGDRDLWHNITVSIPKEGEIEKVHEMRLHADLSHKIEGACCHNNLKPMTLQQLQKINTLLESL